MKQSKILLAVMVGIVTLTMVSSCNKDDNTKNPNFEFNNKLNIRTSLNQDDVFRNLSKVLSKATVNKDLRRLIKTKALEKFDGDFDVLIGTIKDVQINTTDGLQSVKSYLSSIYFSTGLGLTGFYSDGNSGGNSGGILGVPGSTTINPINIIDFIVSVYPEIQVSVPVNVTNWNPETFNPSVTFIPESYNEGITTTIDGYNNNNLVVLDAVNAPANPTLVIGLCERLNPQISNIIPPIVSIVLTATPSATGISLNWTVANPNNDEIIGYRIYKKSLISNDFTLVYSNTDKNNKNYNDNAVNSLQNYFYYVKAYNVMGDSESSNIATAIAPNVPNAAELFTTNHFIQNEIECRWTYPQGQYVQEAKLYKRVIGVNSNYVLLGSFPNSIHEYLDSNVDKGKRVNYKIELINNQGNSNPKYDFVLAPFRNVGVESALTLNKITYESNKKSEIEGWPRGEPEFKISIAKAGQTGDAGKVQSALVFEMGSTSETFNRLMLNWLPSDWAEVLTFSVIEFDGGPKIDLVLNAGFDKKDTLKSTLINGNANVTFDDITNTKDEDCGKMEHKYHNAPSPILVFPLGGVKLHLTN